MKMRTCWATRCLVGLVLSLGFATAAPAQETVGNPLVNGADGIDTAAGAIFVELDGFSQPGTLSSFGFFNNESGTAGRQLTPLVLEQVGSDFFVRGVGAAVTNAASGAQTFPFALTEGSAAVGPNFFFGYKNGTDADPNQQGVIEFSFTPGATSERFFGTNFANNLNPGTNLGAGTFLGPNIGQQERTYSLQATAIPEPAALGVAAVGLLALRRRRAR